MNPGVQKIAEGLYQASFDDASQWGAVAQHVEVAVLMCGGQLPQSVQQIEFSIDDNADGCDRLADVRALAHRVASQRVLSVCHVGENRSGLLSALILIERGMTPRDAVTLVQTRGPHNSPTQAHAFWNPGFVRQVLALEVLEEPNPSID